MSSVPSALLACTIVAVLLVVAFAAACEFDLKFKRCVYGLSPAMLRTDVYLFLESIISLTSIRRSRHLYVSASVAAVVFAAAAVCFTSPGQDLTAALLPPLLYGPITKWGGPSRVHAYAVWSAFFALGFHALPLLGALRAASSSSAGATTTDISPGVRALRSLFSFHEYFLDRQIMTLLQYDNPEPPLRPDDSMSVAHGLKVAVASEMQKSVSESALNHAYEEMLGAGVAPAGAARQSGNGRPSDIDKLTELIEGRGIPFTRSRLKWRTQRAGAVRRLLAEKVEVEVSGRQIAGLWIEDIGRPSERSAWNGFLLHYPSPDDDAEALFRRERSFRIRGLGGSTEEFDCKVTRLEDRDEDDKRPRTLYVGAVVQNRDLGRFSRIVGTVLKAAKPGANGSAFRIGR